MKWLLVPAALVALAAITGCSGSKPAARSVQSTPGDASASGGGATAAAAAPAALNPCTLLTQAEASAALGVKVSPGRLVKDLMGAPTCDFAAPDHNDLTIAIESADFYDGIAANGGVPVPGIGAKALWLHVLGSSTLYILKDGSLADVTFPGNATRPSPAMITAGREIAGRM